VLNVVYVLLPPALLLLQFYYCNFVFITTFAIWHTSAALPFTQCVASFLSLFKSRSISTDLLFEEHEKDNGLHRHRL